MKVGVVMLSELERGDTWSPSYYLDRCKHCGKREADHHDGKCGKHKWVFVESGTSFQNSSGEPDGRLR